MEMKRDHADGSPLSVATWTPTGSYVDMLTAGTTEAAQGDKAGTSEGRGLWTTEEHQNFVRGITLYPSGPWKDIAANVGSRTARQTMTHAQKYRQKIARRLRNARMNAQQKLPYDLDASCPKYNALLSNDEQFNDSILSTTLAIAAEKELDMMEAIIGAAAPGGEAGGDMYQPLAASSEYSYGPTSLGEEEDTQDIAFDECIDFLIAKLHDETLP
jgi:SHAQKYF class myb-like DNA-binding protein